MNQPPPPLPHPVAASRANQPETELPTYGDFFSAEIGLHSSVLPDQDSYREPALRRGEPMKTGANSMPRIFDPVVTANAYCRNPCFIPGHDHGEQEEVPFAPLSIKRATGPYDSPERWPIDG